MEWNDYGNAARGAEVRASCHAEGLLFTIWMTRPILPDECHQACVVAEPDGFVAEGEVPAHVPEAVDWPAVADALSDFSFPKGVATNFAPFVHADGTPWPEKAKPLIDVGWHLLTECYVPEQGPSASPERRAAYARHFTHEYAPKVLAPGTGWYATEPIVELIDGYTLADYPKLEEIAVTGGWSVWAAEYVL